MERRSTQTVLISLASIGALGFAGLWAFLGYKSESYRAETILVAQEIADSSIQSQRNTSLRMALSRSRPSVDDMADDFIVEAQIPDFIGILEREAEAQSVSLDIGGISLGGSPEDVAPRPLSLRLSGECSWGDCVSFISALDASHYALEVRELSLMAGKGGLWRASIDVVQYVTQ